MENTNTTKDNLKEVLMEWRELGEPEGYHRDFDWLRLEGDEILVIMGARRAGKTFLCYQIIRELKKKYPKDNIIYINFEDERLFPLMGKELSILWGACQEVFDIDVHQKVFLFIDEIQHLKNWSKWARRITEKNKNLKLIITGSSAKLLSKEIASELRGRSLTHTVFPLSFSEFLRAKNIVVPSTDLLLSTERPVLNKHFREYVVVGGFPAVLNSPNRQELLKGYYSVMFYRDIVERHQIQNIRLLEDFLILLMDQTSCAFSISSTAKKLSEIGHVFSKNTLSTFMRYACDAFLVFEVKKYCFKVREQLRAYRKIYAIDHSLVDSIRFAFMDNYGRVLENIVHLQLQRQGGDVFYHMGQKECDFIVTDRGRVQTAIQVTKTIQQDKTRQREIEGLMEALEKYQLQEGLILTDDESEDLVLTGKSIKIRPIWWWLLQTMFLF